MDPDPTTLFFPLSLQDNDHFSYHSRLFVLTLPPWLAPAISPPPTPSPTNDTFHFNPTHTFVWGWGDEMSILKM